MDWNRFDYTTFTEALALVARANRNLRFQDIPDPDLPSGRFFILRHDVDYVPAAALALAELEHDLGYRASYFLLLNTTDYNLLAPEHIGVPRRLIELGHEVGLHYDARAFLALPAAARRPVLAAHVALLGQLAGCPVTTIAPHQPALAGPDPFFYRAPYRHVYHDRFVRDCVYMSDSCRAWRDPAWQMLTTGEVPKRLQFALHPINWSVEERDRTAVFEEHYTTRARQARNECKALLEAIAVHTGVVEHERRMAAQRSEPAKSDAHPLPPIPPSSIPPSSNLVATPPIGD